MLKAAGIPHEADEVADLFGRWERIGAPGSVAVDEVLAVAA